MSAICLAGLVLAGCGAPEVEGDPELTVYLSAPLSGTSSSDAQDIADGAEIALDDAGGEAGEIAIRLEVLDNATGQGWDAALTGANARTATQDSTAVAYLGELDSGATRTSLPITNEAGLLQVSPGSGADDLVAEAIGSEQVPPKTQPSGVRTFGRVIPSDVVQGEAAGEWLSSEGVGSVAIEGGDEPFGRALLAGLDSSSGPAQASEDQSPEAVYLAGESLIDSLPRLADIDGQVSAVPPTPGRVPLYGSDALLTSEELVSLRLLTTACETRTECPGAPREVQLTSAALDPAQLPASADGFLAAFEGRYNRAPGRYAAYGYEAMAVILDSIERADDPLDRADVIEAFFATADRESILGTYSIDDVGNTTLDQLGAYRVVAGRPQPEPEPLTVP